MRKGGKNKAFTVYQPVWRMKTLPDKEWKLDRDRLCLFVSLCGCMGGTIRGREYFIWKGLFWKNTAAEGVRSNRKLHTMGLQVSFSLSDFPSLTYTSLLSPPSFLTLLMYILIICKFFLHVCKKKYFYIKSLCRTSAKIGRQYSENTRQGKVRG